MHNSLRSGILGVLCLLLAGCLTARPPAPQPEREQASKKASLDQERAKRQNQELLELLASRGIRTSTDPALIVPLRRVAGRIIEAARGPYYRRRAQQVDWDIRLMDAPHVANALATPSGLILVFSGLYPIAGTEAGLAAIIGHEVAHVLREHSRRRRDVASEEEGRALLAAAILGAGTALASNDAAVGKAVGGVTGDVIRYRSALSVLLPFGRRQEVEADRIGVALAASAGYDPQSALAVWERLSDAADARGGSRLSTHPPADERLSALRGAAAEATIQYRAVAPGAEDLLPAPADADDAEYRGLTDRWLAPRR